jgi:hypothetical protein
VKVNLLLKKRASNRKSVILIVKCKDVRANINIIINKLYYSCNIIKINNINKVKAREV